MLKKLWYKLRLRWYKKNVIAWIEWYMAEEEGEEPYLPDDLKSDVKVAVLLY